MNPSPTRLDHPSPSEVHGFRLGWDHARHGLAPTADLLNVAAPVLQGWRAARAVYRPMDEPRSRHVRRWLALRTRAGQQGERFDETRLTPAFLAELEATHCPITRRPLGGSTRDDDAAELVAVGPGGWIAGRVLMVSRAAARAMAGVSLKAALQWARQAEGSGAHSAQGLDGRAWLRVASLLAFVQPASHAEAARQACTLLPPQRFDVLSPVHGLQAALTCQLASAGWSRRLRELADQLASPGVREDFLLLMGALAPRVLELPDPPGVSIALRHALEDIWLDARVQQRWQQFLLALGESGTRDLLAKATAAGWPGVRERGDSSCATHACTPPAGSRNAFPNPISTVPCLRRPARRHARRKSEAGLPQAASA